MKKKLKSVKKFPNYLEELRSSPDFKKLLNVKSGGIKHWKER